VYCSKIVHTDYPIKIQNFHMLGTKDKLNTSSYVIFCTLVRPCDISFLLDHFCFTLESTSSIESCDRLTFHLHSEVFCTFFKPLWCSLFKYFLGSPLIVTFEIWSLTWPDWLWCQMLAGCPIKMTRPKIYNIS
jgi:hypothetical protein